MLVNTATAQFVVCMSGVKAVGMEDIYNICKVGTTKTHFVQLVVVMNVNKYLYIIATKLHTYSP